MPVTGGIGVSRFGASSWSQTGGAGARQSVVSAAGESGVSASLLQWMGVSDSCHWGGKDVCSKKTATVGGLA